MADKGPQSPDIFVANKVYPDAAGLFFSAHQTLEQIKESCVVILDTNALLVPYGISKNSLSEIASTCRALAAAKRLAIPGQVAREFAKNRPLEISKIFQAVSRKRDFQAPQRGKYPLLADEPSYLKLQELEDAISKLLGEFRDTVGDLLEHIRSWNWNDPVSQLYGEIFPDVVVDLPLDDQVVKDALEYSRVNKVPPGYKDATKDDLGVGDLLVWKVVVHVAEQRKLPVVFVSGDTKPDWFYKSENQALFPRFELVDEIRRVSGGQSLHIVSFSKFLELFGAATQVVNEVKSEEIKIDLSSMPAYERNSVLAFIAEQAVLEWLRDTYPGFSLELDERTGYTVLADEGGASTPVDVRYFNSSRDLSLVFPRLREVLRRYEKRYALADWHHDALYVFLVFETESAVIEVSQRLPDYISRVGIGDANVVLAHLPKGGTLRVFDTFNVLPQKD